MRRYSIMAKLYLNLRCLMLKYDIKQSELAKSLKMSLCTLSRKINGNREWAQLEMYMICDFFNELDPEEKPTPYSKIPYLFPISDLKVYTNIIPRSVIHGKT